MNSYYARRGAHGRPRAATTPRSSASTSRTAGFDRRRCRSTAGSRPIRARSRGARRRRLRVEPRVAAARSGATPPTTSSSAARRTTPGAVLRLMLDAGAEPVGDPHAVPLPSRSMRARRSSTAASSRASTRVSLGIVVNARGERFYDEGEDFWPKRYAIWGRLVAQQPRSDRVLDHRRQGDRPLHAVGVPADRRAARFRELARLLDLPPDALDRDGRRVQRARCVPARSTTRCSTTAAPKG